MNCPHGYEYRPEGTQHNALRSDCPHCRVAQLEAEIAASKQNERRWIAKGEEAIAERDAANKALEAIKKHQEIVAGTSAARMSTTWNIADSHLRSIGANRTRAESAEAKSARLGRKLQRLGLHLCETRKKLRKVEGERDAKRVKVEALGDMLKRCRPYVSHLAPDDLQAALAATEASA
ncbi:hypothetical protein [Humidesulfovibrio idahonensis]